MGAQAADLAVGQTISLAGYIEVNEYRGRRNVQVVVKDIKPS
jgi:hypothetical protein